VIQHIVLFTPKTELAASDRRSFAAEVVRILQDCPSATRCVVGRRVEVDAGYQRTFGDKTYQYAAVIEFDDRKALVSYLNHPAHAALGQLFWDSCENSVICEVEQVDLNDQRAVNLLVERPTSD
jgi:hypothetical protein